MLSKTHFIYFEQENKIAKVLANHSTNGPIEVHAAYLIGCASGRSSVRAQMDIRFEDDADLGKTPPSLVRAPGIRRLYKQISARVN
ncbi:MAG: 2-polyprenyl-6-methoxyphenol hydroxylase-like FAD-dependent oxidoreductase [Candidatus Azotimanducaceae bacterium]|jgi:2-polyprenyl-6-methoxyphenol hydroxylase-like FAD-dependent oxidoreductase